MRSGCKKPRLPVGGQYQLFVWQTAIVDIKVRRLLFHYIIQSLQNEQHPPGVAGSQVPSLRLFEPFPVSRPHCRLSLHP
jgi:hypothetical protein